MSTKTQSKSISKYDKLLAAASYVWVLFVIPILLKRKNEYVMWHARQGVVLFVFELVVILLGMIPLLGWFIVMPLGWLMAIILAVLGITHSMQGNKWNMPFLGGYAKKIQL